ncbi:MAG: alkaline phosphatase family protein, partial [Patescibacteria group bacterium]
MFKWAQEGKLPNIKKLMDRGSYGYSFPSFPSHTPTNFATLLTGSYPEVHGVNDGPMHILGKSLDKVAIGGFRSVAKKVSPIWKTLEEAGLKVALLSIPGSTPPEINKGVVLRGRWGGWGADFNAINFETKGNLSQRILQGR